MKTKEEMDTEAFLRMVERMKHDWEVVRFGGNHGPTEDTQQWHITWRRKP